MPESWRQCRRPLPAKARVAPRISSWVRVQSFCFSLGRQAVGGGREQYVQELKTERSTGLNAQSRRHEEMSFGDLQDLPRRLPSVWQRRFCTTRLENVQDFQIHVPRFRVHGISWIWKLRESAYRQARFGLWIGHRFAEDVRDGLELRGGWLGIARRLDADVIQNETLNLMQYRADQPVLALEVLVESHLCDAAFADNSVNTGGEPLAEEESGGAREDFVFGV